MIRMQNKIHVIRICWLLLVGGISVLCIDVVASDLKSESCLDCHDYESAMAQTEHRIGRISADGKSVIECVSCHFNAEAHVNDPSGDNIGNPKHMNQLAVEKLCETCHIAHINSGNIGFAAHSALEISCVECHTVHVTTRIEKQSELCLKCHQSIIVHMSARSYHPTMEGNVECLDCHIGYSKEYLDQDFNNNISCKNCHVRQSNPHLYEHEAVLAYSVEGDGCPSCHSAHGSENNYLLKQPLNQQCIQCHSPAGHLTAHGGVYANDNCSICHSDIHGSNNNRYFLDRSMPLTFGTGCYNTGCHNFTE